MGTPANRESNRRAPRLRPAHMVPSSYRERPSGVGGLRAEGRRSACAPWARGVEVGTRLANSGFSHSLSLQLTRRAEPSGMLVLAASEA